MAGYSHYVSDLCFRSTTEAYLSNPRFIRRDWLAAELNEELNDRDARFILLCAEPGAGKSAFVAQLAKDHPDWLVYLIRSDQRSPLGDLSATSFLLRLGYQLAAHRPTLFEAKQVKLVVEQRIGDAEGKVVGAEIDRLISSPFNDVVIRLTQDIQRAQGDIVGLSVNEYLIEPRFIPIEDLQFLALIDPAQVLLNNEPEAKIIILVDALDEVSSPDRFRKQIEADREPDSNLLSWLKNAPELPSNIRFVLTTRPPDEAVHAFREKQQKHVRELEIRSDDERVVTEMHTYADRLVSAPEVDRLIDALPDAKDFRSRAAARADGNIGYLDALARGMDRAISAIRNTSDTTEVKVCEQQLAKLLTLQYLPKELSGLYAFFLNEIRLGVQNRAVPVGRNPETGERFYRSAWLEAYRPILGVLAVSMEAPTVIELKALGGISTDLEDVGEAVGRLKQFLDRLDGDRYRLYHSTLGEFLTNPETAEQLETSELYINPSEWHRNIAKELQRGADTAELWKDSTAQVEQARRRYGREHYVEHLYSGKDYGGLFRTIDAMTYGLGKLEFDPSGSLFIQDLDLAARAARAEITSLPTSVANFPALWKYSLLRCALTTTASTYPESTLRTLATLAQEEEAIRLARLMPTLEGRASALLSIVEIVGQEPSKKKKLQALFDETYNIIRRLPDEKRIRAGERLLNSLRFLVIAASWWDDEAISRFSSFVHTLGEPAVVCRFLACICVLFLRRNNNDAATRIIQEALRIGDNLPNREKASTLTYVCMALVEAGAPKHAQVVLANIRGGDRASCLCAVARSMKGAGMDAQALALLAEADDLATGAIEGRERVDVWLDLARTHGELGNGQRAEGLVDRAKACTESVQDENTRLHLLCKVAVGFNRAGLKEKRNRAMADATLIAKRLERSRVLEAGKFYLSYLGPVIETLCQLGIWKHAFRLAERLKTADRDYALRNVAKAACGAKQWDEALRIAKLIGVAQDGSPYRIRMNVRTEDQVDQFEPGPQSLIDICTALSEFGSWQQAVSAADEIWELDAHSAALGAIAQQLVDDRTEDAREVLRRQRLLVRQQGAGFSRNDIGMTCAAMLVHTGEWDLVSELLRDVKVTESHSRIAFPFRESLWNSPEWSKAAQIARDIPDAVIMKAELLIEIAAHMKTDRQAAADLLEEAQRVFAGTGNNNRVRIASVLVSLGKTSQAVEQLKLAEREFRTGGPYWFSPRPIARLPEHFAAAGDFTAALDLARSLNDEFERVYALGKLADAAQERGDDVMALELLQEAAAEVRRMRMYPERIPSLVVSIANTFGAIERIETATALLREFKLDTQELVASHLLKQGRLEEAKAMFSSDGRRPSRVLREIAHQLIASRLFIEAAAFIGEIQDADLRLDVRCQLANALAHAGDEGSAEQQLRTAWSEAATHPDSRYRPGGLFKVASTLITIDSLGLAIELIGNEWLRAESSSTLTDALAAAGSLSAARPQLGFELHEVSKWVNTFIENWGRPLPLVDSERKSDTRRTA